MPGPALAVCGPRSCDGRPAGVVALAVVLAFSLYSSAHAQSWRDSDIPGYLAGAVGDDGIWREDASDEDIWKPEEAEEEAEEESWKEEEDFAEEVAEEGAISPLRVSGDRQITLEYRTTDVFDEPPEPNLGPPADRLFYFAYNDMITRTNYLDVEGQHSAFEDADGSSLPGEEGEPDSGWAMVLWERLLATGARLDLEYAQQWDEKGNSGYWAAAEYGWAAGLNLDLAARLQGASSLGDTGSWLVGMKGTAALSDRTAVHARGSLFRDDSDAEATRLEARLAHYLGRQTGLHAILRRSRSEAGDPDAEIQKASSTVATIELRHRIVGSNTLVRGSYRRYADSEGITANGFSIGAEQGFARGAVGAFYRHHTTSEDVSSGTWWLLARIRL